MLNLRISKSVLLFVLIFTFLVWVYSIVFIYLMRIFENRDYGFITAVYWVVVTMTTTGFGEIYFTSAIGHLFTIVVILSGVIMIFALLFPLVITLWLEETIRKRLP